MAADSEEEDLSELLNTTVFLAPAAIHMTEEEAAAASTPQRIGIEHEMADAVIRGDVATTRRLLNSHPSWITAQDSQGHPLLHIAVVNRNAEMLEVLLNRGAKIDQTDREGEITALLQAVLTDNTVMAKRLIEAGANVNFGGGKRATALYYAVMYRNKEMTHLLLEAGADVEQDAYGRPLIAMAMENESPEIMKLLLDYNIDPLRRYGSGRLTAQHFARRRATPEVREMLDIAVETAQKKSLSFEQQLFLTAALHRSREEILQLPKYILVHNYSWLMTDQHPTAEMKAARERLRLLGIRPT